jgi:hypothetical protein
MGRCFGLVMDMGGSFAVEQFDVGRHKDEVSYCRMAVEADDPELLQSILHELHQNGATLADPGDADPEPAPADRVVPTGFMQGGVSSERPSESLIARIAEAIAETKREGGTVLVVAGPAVIHAGAGDELARLVREGYVDMLSAGNGFAVHDIERGLYGTSLGMDVETMEHPRKGHKHHIYTISEVIRAGSITDAVEAQNAIREQAHRADLVLMLSTLLHSVAVGNCLPSTTRVVCVDSNPSTVTQLLDRGSSQAIGMVTDVGTFVPMLAEKLLDGGGEIVGDETDVEYGHGHGR